MSPTGDGSVQLRQWSAFETRIVYCWRIKTMTFKLKFNPRQPNSDQINACYGAVCLSVCPSVRCSTEDTYTSCSFSSGLLPVKKKAMRYRHKGVRSTIIKRCIHVSGTRVRLITARRLPSLPSPDACIFAKLWPQCRQSALALRKVAPAGWGM